ELADRVGIIAGGRLLSEGTPAELKRLAADDVIEVVAEPDEIKPEVCSRIREMPGVRSVTDNEGRITIRGANCARLVSPVALALDDAGVTVHSVTLREPTLDDAFLALTGQHADAIAADKTTDETAAEPDAGPREGDPA
ncbi:MAG TPA: DUF4162 domain-containing protein, partial [Acidimicrobiales bacterium]|nr:DUF4162 domain-containing protein [Acidimicrobiales bacterium]